MVVLLVVVALPHLSVLVGRREYTHSDIGQAHLPMRVFAAAELARGNLTPWCWLVGCGYPFWASGENGTFYLPNLAFLGNLPVGLVVGWLLWGHYALSALGMYLLARGLGALPLGATVAAAVFNLGGFMIAHLLHFPMLCAAAWLPWLWYGVLWWQQRSAPLALVVIALASCAQLLAGVPQVWVMTVLAALVFAGVLAAPGGLRRTATALGGPLLAVLLGAGLAGVQVLPMSVLVGQSVRATPSYKFVIEFSLNRRSLLSFVDPSAGYALGWEYCAFLGAGALALAVIGAVRRGWSPADRALWAVLIVALAMGFSARNPIYHVLWRLPLVGGIRCWCRWLLPCCGALALLAGLGLTHLQRGFPGAGLGRVRLGLALVGLVFYAQWHLFAIPGIIVVNWEWLAERLPAPLTEYLIHNAFLGMGIVWQLQTLLPIMGLALIVIALERGARVGRWLVPALAVVVVAETTWFGARYHEARPAGTLMASVSGLEHLSGDGRVWELSAPPTLPPETNMLARVAIVPIYYPLQLLRHLEALEAAEDAFADPRVTALFGVRWFLVAGDHGREVLPNAHFRGLAWPVFQVQPEERMHQLLRSNRGDLSELLQTAFVRDPEALRLDAPTDATGRATLLRQDGRGYAFDCQMSHNGLLLITSCWYPGVHAKVDGQPAPVLEANIAFCAVPVPAGAHRVELGYRPAGLAEGIAVSATSLLLGVFALGWLRRSQGRAGAGGRERS